VLERAFTAQDIAEPLISFDCSSAANEVLKAMTVAGIEVAGLHKQGILCGFVEAASLREGSCEAGRREFVSSQVVTSKGPLVEVIEVLTRHDSCFVSALGGIVGVISRIDPLQNWSSQNESDENGRAKIGVGSCRNKGSRRPRSYSLNVNAVRKSAN
jgi:hypothetical protein